MLPDTETAAFFAARLPRAQAAQRSTRTRTGRRIRCGRERVPFFMMVTRSMRKMLQHQLYVSTAAALCWRSRSAWSAWTAPHWR